MSESNRRPLDYKSSALPTELTRRTDPGYRPRRRTTSKHATAAAAATLSDSRRPCIGMLATRSHRFRVRRDRPRPSAPSTSDDGPVGHLELEHARRRRRRRARRSRHRRATRGRAGAGSPDTSAIGRCSTAPAAAFTAAGVRQRAAVAREHHARHARGLGDPQDRAEVPRVGDAVERDEERVGRSRAGRRATRVRAGSASAMHPLRRFGAGVGHRAVRDRRTGRARRARRRGPRSRRARRLGSRHYRDDHGADAAAAALRGARAPRRRPSTCSPPRDSVADGDRAGLAPPRRLTSGARWCRSACPRA